MTLKFGAGPVNKLVVKLINLFTLTFDYTEKPGVILFCLAGLNQHATARTCRFATVLAHVSPKLRGRNSFPDWESDQCAVVASFTAAVSERARKSGIASCVGCQNRCEQRVPTRLLRVRIIGIRAGNAKAQRRKDNADYAENRWATDILPAGSSTFLHSAKSMPMCVSALQLRRKLCWSTGFPKCPAHMEGTALSEPQKPR